MRKLLSVLLVLFASCTAFAACGDGYQYARPLPIWHDKFSSTLANFPLLACFNGACTNSKTLVDLKTVANGGKIQNTVTDPVTGVVSPADFTICTALGGGTAVKHQFITYSASSGAAKIRLKCATCSSTTDQLYWMFYGNSSVTTSQQDKTLWGDANVVAYLPFPNATTLNLKDFAGSNSPTNHSATATGGYDGSGAINFASGQYLDAGEVVQQTANHAMSISAWVKPGLACGGSGAFQGIVTDENGSGTGWYLYWCVANTTHFAFKNVANDTTHGGERQSSTGPSSPASSYSFMVGTYDGTTGQGGLHTYWNGTIADGASGGNVAGTTTNNLLVGKWANSNNPYLGGVQDVRVTSDAPTATWIATMYDNDQNSPNYFDVGPVIDLRTPSGTLTGSVCVPIILNHLKAGSADQTDFPYFWRGRFLWAAGSPTSGHDIRFFSNSTCTTPLDFWRHYYVSAYGDLAFHIRIPTFSHITDTTIYATANVSSFTADLSCPTCVFKASNGVVSVYTSEASTSGGSPDTTDYVGTQPINSCTADVFGAYIPILGYGLWHNSNASQGCGFVPIGADHIGDPSHGTPVGSAARHMHFVYQAVSTTVGVCNAFAGACQPFGWGKANAGFQMFGGTHLQFSPVRLGTFNDAGYATGVYENPSSTPAYNGIDFQPHVYDADYAAGSQIGTGLNIYQDGAKATSPVVLNSTTVLNTADGTGASGNVASVEMFSCPSHASCTWNGYAGQAEIWNVTWSDDLTAARSSNELDPLNFTSYGTASSFTAPAGSIQQLIPGIITKLRKPKKDLCDLTEHRSPDVCWVSPFGIYPDRDLETSGLYNPQPWF
jgi:hypothetical protein